MTTWRPDLKHRTGPRYRAIADAVADDVARGALREGARLPTHRDLAAALGVTVGTVSRAYAEAQRRGLISGEVGRGSFVRRDRVRGLDLGMPAPGEPALVDLSLNFPVDGLEDRELAKALAALGRTKDLARLLEYLPHAGLPRHREAGAAWVARSGTPARPAQIIVCSGAQHGLAISLAALTAPGDLVLAEALTYPVFKTLAGLLHLKIQGIAIDDQGIVPEALEAACKSGAPKILYSIPTIQNPTASVMPETRRRRIAAVALAHGLTILEDDIYGLLPAERPPSLARHAPESTVYVTSLSKTLAPGLRIGYVCAPGPLFERMIPAIAATTWMAPPLMAEIAARWIDDGTADAILKRKRARAAERQRMAANILKTPGAGTRPSGYHLWLPLPEPWRGAEFATRLREQGVAVTPAEAFVAGSGKAPPAVRICLGAARTTDRLERALRVVAGTLEGTHQPEMSVV